MNNLWSTIKFQRKFLYICLFNFIIYIPSLFHMPRSDHLIHLWHYAGNNSLVDLTLNSYNLNRTIALPFKDMLLFRPIVYFFLGAEKWLFGYDFILWQLAGILLHLFVVWCLLKLLLLIHKSNFAFLLAGLFSALLINMEMVTWHHINGYMIFVASTLISLYHIYKIIINQEITKSSLWAIMVSSLVGTFTYEAGSIFCILYALYLGSSKIGDSTQSTKTKNLKTALLSFLYLLPIIYFAISFADLSSFESSFTSAHTLMGQSNLLTLSINLASSFYRWGFTGLFPTALRVVLANRTGLLPNPLFDVSQGLLPFFSNSFIQMIGVVVGILWIWGFFKGGVRKTIKAKWKFSTLLILMMSSTALLLVIGRMSTKGPNRILNDNIYYGYFFWIFFTMLLYYLINFNSLNSLPFIKKFKTYLAVCIIILILANGALVFKFNLFRAIGFNSLRLQTKQIDQLVQKHKSESNFSFWIDASISEDFYLSWVKLAGKYQKKRYTFIRLLFPEYYMPKNPKYTLIGKNGEAIWRKNY